MALQCQMSVNSPSATAGQTPPVAATLTVYNPNAVAVSVTGVDLVYTDPQGVPQVPSVPPSVPPIGIGQTTLVPSLSSITIGPFPIVVNTVASANSFQAVPPGATPSNTQGAMPVTLQFFIGARVVGSDGSINDAGKAGLLISPTVQVPVGYQGGVAQFNGPNNSNLVAALVG